MSERTNKLVVHRGFTDNRHTVFKFCEPATTPRARRRSWPHEPIMCHQPFPAVGVAEQFRTGHPEHAPALEPQRRCLAAVGVDESGQDLISSCILIGEPLIGSALIMGAVDVPAPLDLQVALKPEERVGGRHYAAREEMPAHPVARACRLERIHQGAMREDVHEQLAARPQPERNSAQQKFVISHVLEHFDGNAAIELPSIQVEPIDILRDYTNVAEAALLALCLYVFALLVRVGDPVGLVTLIRKSSHSP
jgi:hypothetical protein